MKYIFIYILGPSILVTINLRMERIRKYLLMMILITIVFLCQNLNLRDISIMIKSVVVMIESNQEVFLILTRSLLDPSLLHYITIISEGNIYVYR